MSTVHVYLGTSLWGVKETLIPPQGFALEREIILLYYQ